MSTERGRAALRKSLYVLRQAIGPELIRSRGDEEVGLDAETFWCDARAFEAFLEEGRAREALELYRGDLLDGFHIDGVGPEFEHWLDSERTLLRRRAAEASWTVCAVEETVGDLTAAVRWARRAFELAPPDEAQFRRLLVMLDRAGDRTGALRAYEKYVTWLSGEYGAEPAPETRDLIEAVRSRTESSPAVLDEALKRPDVAPAILSEEMARVTERPSGETVPSQPARRRWRQRGILVGFLLASALIPTILALRGDDRPPLDPDLLAVAPFRSFSPDHEVWSEGIVDYLSRSLDNAGALRTLSPSTAVRAWPGRADVASAALTGRRTGAGVVVFGSLMEIGPDSVRLNVTVLDVAGEAVLADLEIRGDPGRMDRIVDSLTVELLRGLRGTRQIGAMRHTSIGSRSMPALKAFLQGEQAFRRTAWDTALAHYDRALELDDSFALAHGRLGLATLFMELGRDDRGWEHLRRAGELNHGLSRHDSIMVEALGRVAAAQLGRVPREQGDDNAARAYAAALELAKLYPDDAEAWYTVGLVREMMYDALPSVTVSQISEAYGRAIGLDPRFAPAYRAAFRYALDEGQVERARKLARAYLSLNPPEGSRGLPLLLDRLLDPRTTPAEVDRLLDSLPPEPLFLGWIRLWLLTDSTELAVRVARATASREHDPRYWYTAERIIKRNLAATLAYRGHLREAFRIAGTDYATWFQPLLPELALLGAVPTHTADSAFGAWLAREEFDPRGLGYTLWWWALRSDTTAIQMYLDRGPDRWESQALAALALTRADAAAAIGHLEEWAPRWDDANFGTVLRARLLASVGREAEALTLLNGRFVNDWPLPSRVLWTLERARLAERAGRSERALRDYRFVAAAWRHADPLLEPYVAEARAAVERLSGTKHEGS